MLLSKRHTIISLLVLLGGAFCSANVAAQQTDSSWRDMDYIRNNNAWLGSGNVLGLQYLSVNKISNAKVYFNKSDGKFINFYQSDNSYGYCVNSKKYTRNFFHIYFRYGYGSFYRIPFWNNFGN